MFRTTTVGSLPKPDWLAEPETLWPAWRLSGDALHDGQRRAALEWLREQENAGLDIVGDGEQFRIHFVHGFLEDIEGIDWSLKTRMGIRNNRYEADVPTVTGPLSRPRPRHVDDARWLRSQTHLPLKITLPGPMTLCDTLANAHYAQRADMAMRFAELLNEEALAIEAAGADVIQFDEPAFNVFLEEVREWGLPALERAMRGLKVTTVVHICYGYGIEANIQWKSTLGDSWRQYEQIFPWINASSVQQVSLEFAGSKVPHDVLRLLPDKELLIGAIEVLPGRLESAEEVAHNILEASRHVDSSRLLPCTNCGMAPLSAELARGKLRALGAGAKLARQKI
ncbi:MAG: methionine synthase [Steroidobacteraceae bacterium]|jgi:5-methyltetrahydropteroyltriglutamate--homocysteine methyltransferase|nr:methionine synthase [Gammaproteobacteria bacterium]